MSVFTSPGMPGGSWTIEEDEPNERPAPQRSVSEQGENSPPHPAASIQEPYIAYSGSEVLELDPATLSEEIRLLPSPSMSRASIETCRVRMSPESLEFLPPDPEHDAGTRRIRDSPEQRRSRFLDHVFPEIKDNLHSASRGRTDDDAMPSIFDADWDFEDSPALGLTFPSPTMDDPSREEAEASSRNSSPPLSLADSILDDDDLSSTHSSPSPPVTSISLPSTARPSATPSRSTQRADLFGDSDDDVRDSSQLELEDTVDDPFLRTPSILVDPAVVADRDDSESLPSLLLRPTASSAISDDDPHKEEQDVLEYADLEYFDEYPATTAPSALGVDEISLPLSHSLDSSVGVPYDWEVVSHQSSDDAGFAGGAVEAVADLVEANTPASSDGSADEPVESPAQEAIQPHAEEQSTSEHAEFEANGCSAPDDGMDSVTEGADDSLPHSPAASSDAELDDEWSQSIPHTYAEDFIAAARAPSEGLQFDPPASEGITPEDDMDIVGGGQRPCELLHSAASHSDSSRSESAPSEETMDMEEDEHASEGLQSSTASIDGRLEESSHTTPALPPLHFHSPSLTGMNDFMADARLEVLQFDSQVSGNTAPWEGVDTGADVNNEDPQALESPAVTDEDAWPQTSPEQTTTLELSALHLHSLSLKPADDFVAAQAAWEVPHFHSQASQSTFPTDIMNTAAGDEEQRARAALQSPPTSISSYSNDERSLETPEGTPELPPLHFHSPSLTDEVLSSPEFHAAAFWPDLGANDAILNPAAPPREGRHVRAFTISHPERRSILWAPHDARELRGATRWSANDKGKGRERAHTLSGGSGSAGNEPRAGGRVEREVQTEGNDRLTARYMRVKKQLRAEQAKVAGLVRREKSSESWEARLMGKFQYVFGVPSSLEDEDVFA
ncbi:hypothetical protein B0H19DRAFT_1173640 [Mycena capillaripes]|nr:hypothetical protein B0H19DRAFT_1173640 [Mycena capillaripes]